MKRLDLNYGIQEMNAEEMKNVNGGGFFDILILYFDAFHVPSIYQLADRENQMC
jgi:bacteriocin-like protein